MSKKFVRKNIEESKDIQKDYDYYNYFDAVLKCRIYLESWLGEYIFVILYPAEDEATKQNRQFVLERFDDMFSQIHWLHNSGHISKRDYNNLNRIHAISNEIFCAGDVMEVVKLKQLDRFIEASVNYCGIFKNRILKLINNAVMIQSLQKVH